MKKLTHIAAPVALTALLSACATGPESVTLENLGPGALEAIQNEAVKKLTNPGPDGGLSPVQQAAQDAAQDALQDALLTKPGDNDNTMLQQAVQQVLQKLSEDDEFVRREFFEFDLGGVDQKKHPEIHEKLEKIFGKARRRNPNKELTVSDVIRSLPDRQGVSRIGVRYYVENLAGLTQDDRKVIAQIEEGIKDIPGLGDEQIQTPIRMDPGPKEPVIPQKITRVYTAATGRAEAKLTCPENTTISHQLIGDEEAEGRRIVLSIYNVDDGKVALPPKIQDGPVYKEIRDILTVFKAAKRKAPVEVKAIERDDKGIMTRGKGTVDGTLWMWSLEDDESWVVIQGDKGKYGEWKAVDCVIERPGTQPHYVMAELRPTHGELPPTVVQYHKIDVVNNRIIPSPDEYTEERPACPPGPGVGDGAWDPQVRKAVVEKLPELSHQLCGS